MKKIILVLTLAVLAAGTARAQQWVQKKIADFAVVEFPGAPKEEKDTDQVKFSYKIGDDIYEVYDDDKSSILTLEYSPKALDMYYTANVETFKKKYPKALVQESPFYLDGMKGVQAHVQFDTTSPRQFYIRFLLVNKHFITCFFYSNGKDAARSTSNRVKFFDSFAFTVDKSRLKQTTLADAPTDRLSDKPAPSGAFEAGRQVGMMIVPALLLALVGWGIYKLVKRASAAKS